MFPDISRSLVWEFDYEDRASQPIYCVKTKQDRSRVNRPANVSTDFRGERCELHSPFLLISSFRTTVVRSRLTGTIVVTNSFVTKICCDPRRKFALVVELQEDRVGRNEDLSRPCRQMKSRCWLLLPYRHQNETFFRLDFKCLNLKT